MAVVGMSFLLGALMVAFVVFNGATGHFLKSHKRAHVASPKSGSTEEFTPEAARILLAQLSSLQRQEGKKAADDQKEMTLYTSLGRIYQDAGSYSQAIQYYSMAKDKAVHAGVTEQTVAALTMLGEAFADAGHLQEAKKELESAVLLMDKTGPNAFGAMHGLGNVRRDSGKLEEALALYHEALQLQQKLAKHEDLPNILCDLGLALQRSGKLEDALEKYKQAAEALLALGEQTARSGGNAITLSKIYNSWGTALHDKGDIKQADDLYQKALRVQKAALRASHPSIAETLVNIARAQRDEGDGAAALRTVQDAEELLPKTATRQHWYVLVVKADLLREKGRLDEAEHAMRSAMEAQKEIPGSDETPEMAIQLNSLGSILHDKHEFQEAVNLYFKALKINLNTLGKVNAETAATYNNIANAYQDAGQNEQAQKYYMECLEIQKQAVGEKNPDVAVTYNNIATILLRQHRPIDAEALMVKAIDVVKAAGLPPGHPERQVYEENLEEIREQIKATADAKEQAAEHVTTKEAFQMPDDVVSV